MKDSPNIEIVKNGFSIVIFSGASDPLDEIDDNVDVQVNFADGSFYTATLFTLQNIRTLFEKNKLSGECDSGLFFSCNDMVILERLNTETISRLITYLIGVSELETVFERHVAE